MSTRTRLAALLCATAAAAWAPTPATAAVLTQSATLPLTPTNFNTSGGANEPLVFNKFDTKNDTLKLDSVTLTFHALVKNQFGLTFTTPATETVTVATGDPKTPGPAITLYQPDGTNPLLTVKAPNDANSLTRTVTFGDKGQTLPALFSSNYAPMSPYYLAPAVTEASNSLHLTAPQDLALFTGSGKLTLPVAAQAFSRFTTSSGNGSGAVSTQGTADATITYNYSTRLPAPEVVPEPSAMILWGVGGVALVAIHRARRRASA